jgi:putative flippase GtrA
MALIKKINYLLTKTFLNFIFISLLNTIFGLSIFYFFLFIKIQYQFASLFSTIIGVIFNYYTNKNFVFNVKKSNIFLYIIVYVVVYFFNISILYLFKINSINLYFGGLLLIIPSGLLTYILNKKYVFKK